MSCPSILEMMIGNRKVCVLTVSLLGTLLVVTRPASAKPGRFAQTSFVSTSGANSVIAVESQVRDASGTTSGECAYTDEQGRSIKIKYRETADGVVTAEANEPDVNTKTALEKCREAVARISKEVQKDLKEHDKFFKEQQAHFLRQQEEFKRQQEQFNKQMEDFQNQLQEDQRRLQESIQRQQEQLQQQLEPLFQSFDTIPGFTYQ